MNGPKPFHSKRKVHWVVEFIREERTRQGLTQLELSEKIGARSRGGISNYESGYYTTRAIFVLDRMLTALGFELHIRRLRDKNGKRPL